MANIRASLHDIVRDAPFGQLMRFITKNRVFQYPEEKPGFQLPGSWARALNNTDAQYDSDTRPESTQAPSTAPVDDGGVKHEQEQDEQREKRRKENDEDIETAPPTDLVNSLDKVTQEPVLPQRTKDGTVLVDWYGTDDPENPHNWSARRRAFLASIICAYTFVVYCTSSIYTSSEQGIMAQFGVSTIKASLGLAIYVLGYGIGPLIFSPLSEIPRIGRSPVYIITMFLYVIISIPTALVHNYPGLMVLRFLQGFFGSPCLASGGATMQDMYSMLYLPFAMIAWVASAFCGPALGPLLSGFSVPVKGWRWSLYESIWMSAPVLIAMFLFLPETSTPTILLQRAIRLRKLTGNQHLKAQNEVDQRHMTVAAITVDALIKPMEITIKDPAVLFVQVYSAIMYGIYYSFFEVFPLVYPVYYHMNLGQTGLVFICVLVGCILATVTYGSLLYFMVVPQIKKFGMGPQEQVLTPALIACFGPPVGLFLFAWTARESIHWISPTIGITIYSMSCFIIFQCMFLYVPLSYPQYAASLFAANDFFRSALACGSVIFSHPLYGNLGVHRGTSLLGGLSVIGIIGIWLLFFYGSRLRAMSRFAVYTEGS